MRKFLIAALAGLTALTVSAPASAQNWGARQDYREARRDLGHAQRDYHRAARWGDRRDYREARRDLRQAERRYVRERRDLRRDVRHDRRAWARDQRRWNRGWGYRGW